MSNDPTIPPKRRSKWKAVLLLLFVFLLGAGAGIGTCAVITIAKIRKGIRNPDAASKPMERFFARTESQLAKELALDPTETRAVHDELAITSARAREIRVNLTRDARTLARDTLDRIASHLPAPKQSLLREKAAKKLAPWGLLDTPQPAP